MLGVFNSSSILKEYHSLSTQSLPVKLSDHRKVALDEHDLGSNIIAAHRRMDVQDHADIIQLFLGCMGLELCQAFQHQIIVFFVHGIEEVQELLLTGWSSSGAWAVMFLALLSLSADGFCSAGACRTG